MSIASSTTTTNRHRLEAQALIEATHNYEDEELPDIMQAYDMLARHIGWQDRRRDKRFIVKFHNIDTLHPLFDMFCDDTSDSIEDYAYAENINIDELLTQQCVGHYQAFVMDIPEITWDNIAELAMQAYDEYPTGAARAVEDHIKLVDALQYLEDNYEKMWNEYIKELEETEWKN